MINYYLEIEMNNMSEEDKKKLKLKREKQLKEKRRLANQARARAAYHNLKNNGVNIQDKEYSRYIINNCQQSDKDIIEKSDKIINNIEDAEKIRKMGHKAGFNIDHFELHWYVDDYQVEGDLKQIREFLEKSHNKLEIKDLPAKNESKTIMIDAKQNIKDMGFSFEILNWRDYYSDHNATVFKAINDLLKKIILLK